MMWLKEKQLERSPFVRQINWNHSHTLSVTVFGAIFIKCSTERQFVVTERQTTRGKRKYFQLNFNQTHKHITSDLITYTPPRRKQQPCLNLLSKHCIEVRYTEYNAPGAEENSQGQVLLKKKKYHCTLNTDKTQLNTHFWSIFCVINKQTLSISKNIY